MGGWLWQLQYTKTWYHRNPWRNSNILEPSLYSNVSICYERLFASLQESHVFSFLPIYGNFLYLVFTFLKKLEIACSF